jgi:hypothetical protein
VKSVGIAAQIRACALAKNFAAFLRHSHPRSAHEHNMDDISLNQVWIVPCTSVTRPAACRSQIRAHWQIYVCQPLAAEGSSDQNRHSRSEWAQGLCSRTSQTHEGRGIGPYQLSHVFHHTTPISGAAFGRITSRRPCRDVIRSKGSTRCNPALLCGPG